MAQERITVLNGGLVVRVVSHLPFKFPSVQAMKERYGPDYPDDFPYDSRAIFAFQEIDGRDVCLFAMYVQEYGPDCPQPNTNRTYISYLDSVQYLRTDPPHSAARGTRTICYHALINGYLKHACERGFERAHIWVAPPQPGDEYIFHRHPSDPRYGHKPMSMNKLREWYVKMLDVAKAEGIVTSYEDIEAHVSHLTSIKEFPLFEGDFFPDHLRTMLAPPPPSAARAAPPGLVRETSNALVTAMKNKTRAMRKRFLVAALNTEMRSGAKAHGRGKGTRARSGARDAVAADDDAVSISHALVDKRSDFLGQCQRSHWQFDELRRAHFSTMMLLAMVGGPPTKEDCAALLRR
jgi:E1A/CREB-binding protein